MNKLPLVYTGLIAVLVLLGHHQPKPPITQVLLTWTNNFNGATNIQTQILSTTSLITPHWVTVWAGETNQTMRPVTNNQEFFYATNVLKP